MSSCVAGSHRHAVPGVPAADAIAGRHRAPQRAGRWGAAALATRNVGVYTRCDGVGYDPVQ
jgi:hypothetical protein